MMECLQHFATFSLYSLAGTWLGPARSWRGGRVRALLVKTISRYVVRALRRTVTRGGEQ